MRLQDRIRAGDWAAFDDPALELHLLEEPGAPWLAEGLLLACLALGRAPQPHEVHEQLDAWTDALKAAGAGSDPAALRPHVARGMTMLRMAVSDAERWQRALAALLRGLVDLLGPQAPPRLLDLARRLRSLRPEAPPGLDRALDALRWMRDSEGKPR